ncbi:hypothetical protein [Enterococcus phage vB_EfKS5]|nr:hypothetical protein [Enterococcus phage vB_EfKS5]
MCNWTISYSFKISYPTASTSLEAYSTKFLEKQLSLSKLFDSL